MEKTTFFYKNRRVVKKNQNTEDADHTIVNNSEKIENVEFVYFGTPITNDYDDTKEIGRRLIHSFFYKNT